MKKSMLKNQKGQGVMEYIIISSLVGIVCLMAVKQFGGEVNKRVVHMKEKISKQINIQGRK